MKRPMPYGGYWDAIVDKTQNDKALEIWRQYSQRVYRRLIRDWFPPDKRRCLKTDLFEEAVTAQSLLPDLGAKSIGIDISPAVVHLASRRLRVNSIPPLCLVGDLRQLPLASGTIHGILSGSSLDHFPAKADIAICLAEFKRVLAKDGVLILTLDNPENPFIWLRNRLPFGWLNRLRLVPFYVGATYGEREARQQLDYAGLRVTDLTTVAHIPRAPAIWLSMLIARLGWNGLENLCMRFFDSFEVLGRLPTRRFTGYYLAVRASQATGRHENSRAFLK